MASLRADTGASQLNGRLAAVKAGGDALLWRRMGYAIGEGPP